jgi:hypothetical protein
VHFRQYTAHCEKKLNYAFLANMQSETKHFCRKRKVELYVFGDSLQRNLIIKGNFKFNLKILEILDLSLVYY